MADIQLASTTSIAAVLADLARRYTRLRELRRSRHHRAAPASMAPARIPAHQRYTPWLARLASGGWCAPATASNRSDLDPSFSCGLPQARADRTTRCRIVASLCVFEFSDVPATRTTRSCGSRSQAHRRDVCAKGSGRCRRSGDAAAIADSSPSISATPAGVIFAGRALTTEGDRRLAWWSRLGSARQGLVATSRWCARTPPARRERHRNARRAITGPTLTVILGRVATTIVSASAFKPTPSPQARQQAGIERAGSRAHRPCRSRSCPSRQQRDMLGGMRALRPTWPRCESRLHHPGRPHRP